MEDLLAARLQMAFTLGFHIILACFGVGLPVLMIAAEGMFLRTGKTVYQELAIRWAKAFAVLFAIGAVSGTVLSFELGLLWPKFMGTFGSVISLPFTLEGFAFFLEAIFVGIYLYGWKKLSPIAHWLSAIPIAISGFASAWFVVTANAWMNSPQGFDFVDGVVQNPDPITAMLNPATMAQTTHMILAAYIVSGFSVASFYGWQILRKRDSEYNRIAMMLGLTLGAVCMPFQMAVGDWSAKVVAKTQPIKFAAMESHFHTETGASIVIGGIPDMEAKEVRYGIKIPKLLSFLAYGDFESEVKGLEDFPADEIPPVPVVHIAFQLMVGFGTLMMFYSVWCLWLWVRNRPAMHSSKIFLWSTVLMGPSAVIAMETGWTVTEVGRQPWIVYGIMRTRDAVTGATGLTTIFVTTLLIYAILLGGCLVTLRFLAAVPLEEPEVRPLLNSKNDDGENA
ncbi:MAG: cytochrome ubiquinol oxidase subunit I [Mariniblastus sp.]